MRLAPLVAWSALALLLPSACSSAGSSTTSALGDEGGAAGGGDGGGAVAPAHEACSGPASGCLSGTASTRGFTAKPARMEVNLFRVFPSQGSTPLATVPVALDGTWAIDGLPAWGHYYAQLAADFGQPVAIAALAGPLRVPSSGGPIGLAVKPVQVVVLEQASGGGGYQVAWADAHVFDPSSGAEIRQTASVAIEVGGTSVPMPWGVHGGQPAYFVSFSTPPAAQTAYTLTTSAPAFGSTAASWQLVASPPAFTAALSSPASGSTVPVGQPLTVAWPAQPAADYVVVELFEKVSGAWSTTYGSAQPDAPDTVQETVPAGAITQAGSYLLDVYFSKANCPSTADGCVLASAIADAQLTAQ